MQRRAAGGGATLGRTEQSAKSRAFCPARVGRGNEAAVQKNAGPLGWPIWAGAPSPQATFFQINEGH